MITLCFLLLLTPLIHSLELPDPLGAFGTQIQTSSPREIYQLFVKAQEDRQLLNVIHTGSWLIRNKIRVKPDWMAEYLLKNQQRAMALLVAYYYGIPEWATANKLQTTEQSIHWFLEWMAFIHKIYANQTPPLLPENPYCQAQILLSNHYTDAAIEILSSLPEEPFGVLTYLKIRAKIIKPDVTISKNLIFRGLLTNLNQPVINQKLDMQYLQDEYPLNAIGMLDNTLEIYPGNSVTFDRIHRHSAKIQDLWLKTTELDINLKPLTILGIAEFSGFFYKYDSELNTLMVSDKFWNLNQDQLWPLLKHHLALHQLIKNHKASSKMEFLFSALAKTYAQIPKKFFGSSEKLVLWPLSKLSLMQLEPLPDQKVEFMVLQDLLTELGLFLFDPSHGKTVSHKISELNANFVLLNRHLDQFYSKNFKKDQLTGY